MKRKRVLLMAVFMTALLSACQSVSSQPGKDGADNILQESVLIAEGLYRIIQVYIKRHVIEPAGKIPAGSLQL